MHTHCARIPFDLYWILYLLIDTNVASVYWQRYKDTLGEL